MSLKDLASMFNHAFAHAFGVKKFFCLFITLAVSGLIFLFFQAIAAYAPLWLQLPLQCLPLFLIIGLLMAAGSMLIRIYAEEREKKISSVMQTVWSSWDLVLRALYLALPLLLAFLLFWVLIGIFMLLKAIPVLGPFLGILLAFAPFLLNFGTLILFFIALLAFFFAAPPLAVNEQIGRKILLKRVSGDLFSNLLLLGIAYLPVWIVWKFVGSAAQMTLLTYAASAGPIQTVLQSAFMMLPLVAILTPAVIFFFNFAYEAYFFLRQKEEVT